MTTRMTIMTSVLLELESLVMFVCVMSFKFSATGVFRLSKA